MSGFRGVGADWTNPWAGAKGAEEQMHEVLADLSDRGRPWGAPDSWAGHFCSCYFALCFLQIMIEFCPGGAVDAIMLGESFLFFGLSEWLAGS